MYNPSAFAVTSSSDVVTVVRRIGFGHLVTHGTELAATALPFVVDDDLTTVRAHIARANKQWRVGDGATAMLIVPGDDAYVSPRWYPSKAEGGRVVPTWNYELVHLHGTIEVHHDAEWKLGLVRDLTDHHERITAEADEGPAWKVSDAPEPFIAGQLKAIVGIQLNVSSVEAKRKLSQNRSEPDRSGAASGLAESESRRARDVSALMRPT